MEGIYREEVALKVRFFLSRWERQTHRTPSARLKCSDLLCAREWGRLWDTVGKEQRDRDWRWYESSLPNCLWVFHSLAAIL